MMQRDKLSQIQTLELDIMRELLPIFERENIRYFMQGGTMLGAVRHHGFVPWDDDIDIGILRPDYERFLELCKTVLPEHLKLRTYKDDSYHHYYFSRVVDTRYHIRRSGGMEERQEELWIDIFPLDGMPENKIKNFLHKVHLVFYRFLYSLSCFTRINIQRPGRPLLHRFLIRAVLVTRADRIFAGLDSRKLLDKIDILLKKYPVDQTVEIINFMGDNHIRGYSGECYGIGETCGYVFEDLELSGLKDYDYYLQALYGNYMEFPPAEKRNIHMAELVEQNDITDQIREEGECGFMMCPSFREEAEEKCFQMTD